MQAVISNVDIKGLNFCHKGSDRAVWSSVGGIKLGSDTLHLPVTGRRAWLVCLKEGSGPECEICWI